MTSDLTEMNRDLFLPSIQKFYSLDLIAKEPWSSDTTVYVSHPGLILLESGCGAESFASIFLLKTLGLPYNIQLAKNVNNMSPSSTGPLLKSARFSIGQFEPIVNFCALKGHSLNKNQDQSDDSNRCQQVKIYLLLIQNAFSNILNYFLWKEPINHAPVKNALREHYPWPLNYALFVKEFYFNKKKLMANGLWNKEPKQALANFIEIVESLDKKLNSGNSYLLGNQISEVDILLYSFIKVTKTNSQFNTIYQCLNNFNNLAYYFNNMNEIFKDII